MVQYQARYTVQVWQGRKEGVSDQVYGLIADKAVDRTCLPFI